MADDQSVFAPTQETNPPVSDNNTEGTSQNPLEEWIGEGKKYKSPDDALASIPHAQKHISTIEAENLELKRQIDELSTKGGSIDKVLELLQQREQSSSQDSATAGTIDEDALSRMVEQVVDKRSVEQKRKDNLDKAETTARQLFGDKAANVVSEKAKSLGVNVDFLQGIAENSPSAFIKLISEQDANPTNHDRGAGLTNSSVNTESLGNNGTNEKNFAYYNNLRRQDSRKFYSSEVQKEMMHQRSKLGDKFYK